MPEPFPHFNSLRLNRRHFLQWLWGMAGLYWMTESSAASLTSADFGWVCLKTGLVGSAPTRTVGLPGSLMKLIATAALLEEGLLSLNHVIDCRGQFSLHGITYHCQVPHGYVSLPEALARSCNIFFAEAADLMSPGLFLKYARLFGLDQPVAGVATGSFPQYPEDPTQAYVLGLSSNLQPTLLHHLQLSGFIARGGTLPSYHFVGHSAGKPLQISLSPETWMVLRQGMHRASRMGTAKFLDPEDRLHVSAKTGTAPHGKNFQSWITGFFPREAPRYAFCLRAFAGTSQGQAVPLAREALFSKVWL